MVSMGRTSTRSSTATGLACTAPTVARMGVRAKGTSGANPDGRPNMPTLVTMALPNWS